MRSTNFTIKGIIIFFVSLFFTLIPLISSAETLTVFGDSGDGDTLARAKEQFEASHPGDTIEIDLIGWDDFMATVTLRMASDNPPDIAQGNQGPVIDGKLIQAGLIIPLDKYAEQYGWIDTFGKEALAEFMWSPDGSEWGKGSLFGINPVSEDLLVFYNKEKLASLGLSLPTTFAEFENTLAVAHAKGELAIQLGNADAWPGTHVWNQVEGVFDKAKNTRDWIFGVEGSRYDIPERLQAAQKIVEWVESGYFGSDFNGVGYDDAATYFTQGEGLYLPVGTWMIATLAENMGDNVGAIAMPPKSGNSFVSGGSFALPWHISSKASNPDLAAEFIALLMSKEFIDDIIMVNRVPAQAATIAPQSQLLAEVIEAANKLIGDNGKTFYPDWSTPTMYDTFSQGFQKLLGGVSSPEEYLADVQADYEKYHSSN